MTEAYARTARKPGRHSFPKEDGLCLVVSPSLSKRWVQRLTIRGQSTDLGLGGYPLVSLMEARERAHANRQRPHQALGYRTPAEVYQHGQEERGAAAEEAGLPWGLVKPSAGVGDSLNLALVLS